MPGIVITHCEISTPSDQVFQMAQDDLHLIEAIDKFRKEKEGEKVDIWRQDRNIIVTEEGYYMAFFQEDLVKKISG